MSAHSFIAHYLKENGYTETLKAFEAEYGKPIPVELPLDENLVDIISDRLKYLSTEDKLQSLFDHFADPELSGIKKEHIASWSAPYPQKFAEIASIDELVIDSAVFAHEGKKYVLLATTAKNLVVVDIETGSKVTEIKDIIGKVVVRKVATASQYVLLCGMNGKVTMGTFGANMEFSVVAEHQIHARLVTDIRAVEYQGTFYLVSLGWDFLVKLFKVTSSGLEPVGEPYKLANQGTCFDVCVYKDRLVVLVGKNEITLMDVLSSDGATGLGLDFRIALNDAEFSASGFTPMCVKIFPGDIPLVAVGTSHQPFMRVVLVTLKEFGTGADGVKRNQILANVNTMSPQDNFSQAVLEWRYDGSGLWIVGDDGIIRGYDLSKERVIVSLEGHDGRIKAISVDRDTLLTCGTDRRVLLWK